MAISAAILAATAGLVMLPRLEFHATGEPFAVAKVQVLPAPPKLPAPDVTASARETASPPAISPTQPEASGVKVIRGGSGPSGPLIIDVARALAARAASAQPDPQGSP